MTRIRGVSGGGPQGQFVSETRAPKREPINHNISQNRPSQIGMSVHYHKTDLYESSTTPEGTDEPHDCGTRIGPHGPSERLASQNPEGDAAEQKQTILLSEGRCQWLTACLNICAT
jgi:hypothetical protein